MRLSSITIDADGTSSEYVAWYNHSTNLSRMRLLRPSARKDSYSVQRMEMLAIYFALADNWRQIRTSGRKKRRVVINVRIDSKSSVEQLQGISEVRDGIMWRICASIRRLLKKMSYMIIFNHLKRARNIAGLLLEQRRRKEEERLLMHRYYREQHALYSLAGTA